MGYALMKCIKSIHWLRRVLGMWESKAEALTCGGKWNCDGVIADWADVRYLSGKGGKSIEGEMLGAGA